MTLDWLKTPNKQRGYAMMVVGGIIVALGSLLFVRGCEESKLPDFGKCGFGQRVVDGQCVSAVQP